MNLAARLSALSMLVAFATLSGHSQTVVFGNFPQANGASYSNIHPTEGISIGIEFETGNESNSISTIKLRLSLYDASDVPEIGIFSDAGNAPGSLIGSLFSNPNSSSGSDPQVEMVSDQGNPPVATSVYTYDFVAGASVTLAPNTSYWINVDSSSNGFKLHGDGSTPTGAYTFLGMSDGVNYITSQGSPSVQLLATSAVPEPSTYALLFGVCALLVVSKKRRHKIACDSQ